MKYYCYLRKEWTLDYGNVGDLLTPIILRYLGISELVYSTDGMGRLLGVGSIISGLHPFDTIWGSGLIRDQLVPRKIGVNFLAVRGPLTRNKLLSSGYKKITEVFGDPAILMPRIYNPVVSKKHVLGVIPHFVDYDDFSISNYGDRVRKISIMNNPYAFIDEILQCEYIASSSLHGIILAEAYGIPAIRLKQSERIIGGDFKYSDWYNSTNRLLPRTHTVSQAIEVVASERGDNDIPERIHVMADGLLKSIEPVIRKYKK